MIKNIIKKIPGFNYFNNKRKNMDFNKDKKFYLKRYMYSKPVKKEKLEYDLLFEIHKLEKGFAVKNPRPFGIDKIKRIIFVLKEYEKNNFETSFAYNLGYSSLKEYLLFFEEQKWTDQESYKIVKKFMDENHKFEYIPVGAYDLKKKDFINDVNIDYMKFVSSRKSIRNFSNKKLEDSVIKSAVEMAIMSPSACNRQMCKIYYIKDVKSKKVIEQYAQGLGLFDLSNANYFVITFDVNANYFIGERNQGWFNAGLMSMNFVNALHSLGIGSCFIQFGNSFKEEKMFKKELNIPDSERIAVIITAGYYDEISRVPYSTRKPIVEIYRER